MVQLQKMKLEKSEASQKIMKGIYTQIGTLITGIISSLSNFGKLIVIILMFIGRIGPITFGRVLLNRKK